MAKISFGEKLKSLFGVNKKIDESFFEDLTHALIEGDIGAKTAMEIVDSLEDKCKAEKIEGQEAITSELKKMLLEDVKQINLMPEENIVISHDNESFDWTDELHRENLGEEHIQQ